ncbi:MAG: GGDEF domain-containing protein [Methylomonas sp.]
MSGKAQYSLPWSRLAHCCGHGDTAFLSRNPFLWHLKQTLMEAAANNEAIAGMRVNLDHFKTVNHTFGYAVGDRLLQTIAERLQKF